MRIMKPLVPLSAMAVALTVSTASKSAQASVSCDYEDGSAPAYEEGCRCEYCQGTEYPDDRCTYCWDAGTGNSCYDRGVWATYCDPNDRCGAGPWMCAE
jgi:hypothetical protein